MTSVKNPVQATAYGLPMGTSTAIAVPTVDNAGNAVVPQAQVDYWASTIFKGPVPFAAYWWPKGSNDYKTQNAMYDAYGNFAYGATAAAGYSLSVLQFAAEAPKKFNNNPINTVDINSGFNAINNGGTLTTIEFTPPSVTPNIPTDFGVTNPNSGWSDSSSAAAGGFLIYPNKPNTNQMQSVYSK